MKEEDNWLKDFVEAGKYQKRWEYEDAMAELGLPCQEEDKLKVSQTIQKNIKKVCC